MKHINIWINGIVLSDVYLKKGSYKNDVVIMRDDNYIAFFDINIHHLKYDGKMDELNDYILERKDLT